MKRKMINELSALGDTRVRRVGEENHLAKGACELFIFPRLLRENDTVNRGERRILGRTL